MTAVIVLCIEHHDEQIEGENRKPEMILLYSEKECITQTILHQSLPAAEQSWPMVVFYNMLDVAGVAAFVIWVSLNPDWAQQNPSGRRRMFLQELGHTLIDEHLTACMQNPRILQSSVKLSLRMLEKLDVGQAQGPLHGAPAQKRCRICPRNTDRKTADVCAECHRNVCTNHATLNVRVLCQECSD